MASVFTMWILLCWWILACIKRLLLWIPFVNRSFVILSSGRSGSTLLVQLLNCHPNVACKGELLNRNCLQIYNLRGATSPTLINYILASLIPSKLFLLYTGFKLFNEQLEFCNLRLKDILTSLLYPHVIILYRENMLETYVSLEIAFKTDVWYSEDGGSGERIKLDWQKFLDYAETERARWKRSMMDMPVYSKVLFISYEELIENRNKTMSRIFQFMGLDMCHVEAASKKQNPLSLKEKIINYDQIKQRVLECEESYAITKQWLEMMCSCTTAK